MANFFDRFSAAKIDEPVFSLQVVYPEAWAADAVLVEQVVRAYHPDFAESILEWEDTTKLASASRNDTNSLAFAAQGPPAIALGLLSWQNHVLKVAAFDAPMPYGPIESCVVPALMPEEVKADAAKHRSHLLLYHAGPETDPRERMLGLALAAGAFSTLGATAILHEEARTAIPAFDLWPEDDQEDIRQTLQAQPLLYLNAGFVRTNVGAPDRPWIRTFGCHRYGLPDLATQARGYQEGSEIFSWFQAILNYLTTTEAGFLPGQTLQLNDDLVFRLREPAPTELDFLQNDGPMIVLERAL